jgi:hypothetical protein
LATDDEIARDLSLSNDIISTCIPSRETAGSAHAVILIPCLGQKESIAQGIEVAQRLNIKTLVYGGNGPAEIARYGAMNLNYLEKEGFRVITHIHAEHTRAQAAQVLQTLKNENIRSCLLTAPEWHLIPRAYLTYIAEVLRMDYRVRLYPYPVVGAEVLDPTSTKHAACKTIEGARKAELSGAIAYWKTRDVASSARLLQYLKAMEMLPS